VYAPCVLIKVHVYEYIERMRILISMMPYYFSSWKYNILNVQLNMYGIKRQRILYSNATLSLFSAYKFLENDYINFIVVT